MYNARLIVQLTNDGRFVDIDDRLIDDRFWNCKGTDKQHTAWLQMCMLFAFKQECSFHLCDHE